MHRVRLLFPTAWDRQQLLARPELWRDTFTLQLEGPDDADCRDDFDVLAFVDGAAAEWRGHVDGVLSSSDYPGIAVAAAIGTALGLPASAPANLMRAAHKGQARAVQAAALPELTPAFAVLDPDRLEMLPPGTPLPCFVKPAKGCYSVLARRVDDEAQLRAFLADPRVTAYRCDYLHLYAQLVARYLGPDVDATAFVAEEVLRGHLVTVEGYSTDRDTHALGVVDSLRHERTGSFTGFRYPSLLPAAVCQRLQDAACRTAAAFGLRWTMWNVEFLWDPASGRIGIVEINPRLCGQFADLYEKVDGSNGYAIALQLAVGEVPDVRRGAGACAVAASFPLRVFEPVRVLRAPDERDLAAACASSPRTLVWNEVATGDALVDFATADDGASYRYAVINVGGRDDVELAARRDAALQRLGYRFAPA